jgi:hypothetical protein
MATTARTLGIAAAVAMGAAPSALAGEPTLFLRVDNQARLTVSMVRHAQAIVSNVYTAIGVHVVWTNAPLPPPDAAMYVTIVLTSGKQEAELAPYTGRWAESLGLAAPNTGRVYIFCTRVADLARVQLRPPPLVLGRVLAHEVGHQLLPGKGHTTAGIMRAKLDYRSDAPGFTADEGAAIRALLTRRSGAGVETMSASSAN